jgi:hypothetical protein
MLAVEHHAEPEVPLGDVEVMEEAGHVWGHGQPALALGRELLAFTAVPVHSKAALSGATSPNPTFKADKDRSYVVQLVVNDGTANSAPATVTILAMKGKK